MKLKQNFTQVLIPILSAFLIMGSASALQASNKSNTKSTKKTASKNEDSKASTQADSLTSSEGYNSLFKGKKVLTAKGEFMTIHKIENDTYFELPTKYLKKEILFGTTVSSVSEPDILTVGMVYNTPLLFFFDVQGDKVLMKKVNTTVYVDKPSAELDDILENNFRDPALTSFTISAYTPDSSAVVFSVNSLVGQDNSLNPIIPKQLNFYTISSSPRSDLASVLSVKAFDNNVSVRTELSYNVSVTLMGLIQLVKDMPLTTEVVHTFTLLPEEKMVPRFADARVGISDTKKISFLDEEKEGLNNVYFTNRWRLEPQNLSGYFSGEKVEPKEPIVFYIDSVFPDTWKKPIYEGVLNWNKAFEALGYKNAIQVKEYPTDNTDFDPDNMNYSCIRYVPSRSGTYVTNSWVDPRTGEIVNGSILIHNGIEEALHEYRFVQTANVDPSVRGNKLPTEAFQEALKAVVTHATGRLLGLEVNLSASASVSVAQLRDKNYTNTEGLSASIMDNLSFNYIAQPTDAGVSLVSSDIGAYDYYAIDYNYRFLNPDLTPLQQYRSVLEKMVDAKSQLPQFRYVPAQQRAIVDPSVISNDLGNDPLEATILGMKNLKSTAHNLPKWITNDEDSRIKTRLYLQIAQQNFALFKNAVYLLGGVYLNNTKESSSVPRYQVVDKDKQKEALRWAIHTIIHFKDQSNIELEKKGFIEVSYFDQLVEYLASEVFNRNSRVLAAWCLDKESYSQSEFFGDLFALIYAKPAKGESLQSNQMFLQRYFVDAALSALSAKSGGARSGGQQQAPSLPGFKQESVFLWKTISPLHVEASSSQVGFGTPNAPIVPNVFSQAEDQTSTLYLHYIEKLKPIAEKGLKRAKTTEMKSHYNYLLLKVNKILEENRTR